MNEKFNIFLDFDEDIENDFPRVSFEVTKYIWNYIEKELLIPNKIWVNDKYKYILSLIINKFNPNGFYQENIFNTDETKFLTPKFSTSKSYKQASLFVYSSLIGKDIKPNEFAILIYDAFASLILVYTKKLTKADFDGKKQKIDFQLIDSFLFPVTLEKARNQIW